MQNNIVREAQTMILIDHPNVVKAHCSFAKDQTLWVVMPYMAGGSCLHIMKSVHPTGFEEPIIATILREVLKGLEYLHHHGSIHRDVKVNVQFQPDLCTCICCFLLLCDCYTSFFSTCFSKVKWLLFYLSVW